MPRLIKRYGSRKLYDTVESQYISLQQIATWIRDGEQVQIIDNKTGEDVTVQILTQVISEQGRRGESFPVSFLHDMIRVGEDALHTGETVFSNQVKRLQDAAGTMATVIDRQVDRLRRPAPVETQLSELTRRLQALEEQLERLQREE